MMALVFTGGWLKIWWGISEWFEARQRQIYLQKWWLLQRWLGWRQKARQWHILCQRKWRTVSLIFLYSYTTRALDSALFKFANALQLALITRRVLWFFFKPSHIGPAVLRYFKVRQMNARGRSNRIGVERKILPLGLPV